MNPSDMNNEQLRIAVAEALGWVYTNYDVESYACRAWLAGRQSAKSKERKP